MNPLQESLEEKLRKFGYEAGFCPNNEWIKKVAKKLLENFNITEKTVDK